MCQKTWFIWCNKTSLKALLQTYSCCLCTHTIVKTAELLVPEKKVVDWARSGKKCFEDIFGVNIEPQVCPGCATKMWAHFQVAPNSSLYFTLCCFFLGFDDQIKRKRSGTAGNSKIITKKGIQDNRWQDGTDGNSKLPLTGLASTCRQTTERRRRGDTWTIITKKCSEIKKLTRNRRQAAQIWTLSET